MNTKAIELALAWKEKWYGFWADEARILGRAFSLDEHVDATWQPEDITELIYYLKNSAIAIVAQTPKVKCGLCDELMHSSCYRSDGELLWCDSLPHLLEKHAFVLPDNFVNHIRQHQYQPPTSFSTAWTDLPWPDRSW